MTDTHPASSPADTKTFKQWGIQSPDGEFHWETITVHGRAFGISSNGLHSLEMHLGDLAQKMHMDPMQFRAQYRLVSRDVVVNYAPSVFSRGLD